VSEFAYKVGDRIRVDRPVLEEHGEVVRGFTEQFKDLDNVLGTVKYIRVPFEFRGEARVEPTIGVVLDEIPGHGYPSWYYFPHELALISRGVNLEELTKLSRALSEITVRLNKLTA
jgi:hypothetical protein